ncbi:MAG: quinoprotein dehydrogenase-associated putative ABC transporter substrate-binding protein [Candidatus Angelobacter sp.]
MFSATRLLLLLTFFSVSAFAAPPVLRVCADPNNLPYSNRQQAGFENALARLVAHDLGMTLSYYWFPQRHKFFAKTLFAGECDVVMEVPTKVAFAATTVPYYRSSYVFVSPHTRNLRIRSFDDARLHDLRIGVQVTGDNDDRVPATAALLKRGLVRNLAGYSVFGNLSDKNPSANIIRAVADKAVDLAVVWGPLGGYFAARSAVPLDVTAVCGSAADQQLPLEFDISMGVRPNDVALRNKLNAEIARRRSDIQQLLQSFGVPIASSRGEQCESGAL